MDEDKTREDPLRLFFGHVQQRPMSA